MIQVSAYVQEVLLGAGPVLVIVLIRKTWCSSGNWMSAGENTSDPVNTVAPRFRLVMVRKLAHGRVVGLARPIHDHRDSKGDVIWIPAGVKHWHGATPTTTMTHIAFQEQVDGTAVNWLEKVTAEQYQHNK